MKKRVLSVLLAFALLCTMLPRITFYAASAEIISGYWGENIVWTLDSETGLLTIGGRGDMKNCSMYGEAPWHLYSTSITKVQISTGVTSIGSATFWDCLSLTSVDIADSVTYIGSDSFRNCTSLNSFVIPNSVTAIGAGAFAGCSALITINIPASVGYIGPYAFWGCYNLESINVSEENLSYSSDSFGVLFNKNKTTLYYCPGGLSGEYAIPDGVINIDAHVVHDCTALQVIRIPDSVSGIHKLAFDPCNSLTGFDVSSSNLNYSSYQGVLYNKDQTELLRCPGSFSGSLIIPSGVTKICDYAFSDCSELTSVSFPEGVLEIGDAAFSDCSKLIEITLPGSLKNLGSYTFVRCSNLETAYLLNGITSVPEHMFARCETLNRVVLPDSLLTIESSAFSSCRCLQDIIIPEKVVMIGSEAFYGCLSLYDFSVPSSVINIGSRAFGGCYYLNNIYILNSLCSIDDSEETWSGDNDTLGNCKVTVVHGYTDSTAQAYSQKYGFTFVALDGEPSGNLILSDEITHLIFSDLAYRHINREYVGRTVAEWQADIAQEIDEEIEKLNADPSYKPKLDHNSFNELNGQLYDSDSLRVIDALGMVGDWVIKEVIHGDNGYAAAVFQKGNDYIIAYRGSEGDPINSISEGTDWAVDAKFALFNHLDPKQFSAALETYYKYADKGNVTLTGHSLGGALVTYVSILTGAKGYSFDGAAGHVVDLTYLFEPLRIDFSSKNNMTFSNYTDPPGASTLGADLIQHTNADLFPGVCYKTNPNAAKNGYPEFFWTHQRFSNTKLSEDGKAIEFMPVAETHSPKTKWYASVDYEYLGILEGAAAGALGGLPSGLAGGVIGAGVGRLVKKGNVILGDTGDDNLSVLSFISNPLDYTAVVTKNVIYGGDGKDVLYGAAGSDVLAPGELKGDLLCGGLGNDDYILDCKSGGEVYISDSSGSDRIILNGVDTVYSFENEGSTADGKWEIYCANNVLRIYVQKTIFSHKFSIIDVSGASYGTVDSKRITTRGGETEAGAEKESKEILVLGDAQIVIYDESRTVVSEILTSDYGLRSEEYGTIYAANDGEQNYFSATIYENYSIEVIGDSVVDVQIIGTDSNGNMKKTTQAKDIDLQWADAEIDSAKQTVTQNGVSAVTCVTDKTVGVSIRQTLQELSVDETATLSATAFFEDGSQSTDVYWVSSDASVVRCDYDEGGECIISAVEVGNATIYAIASDSGCFASCELQVKSNTLVPCDGGENCPGNVFTDMPPKGNWAHDAIDWAIVNKITAGTSATTFSPNAGCTRAQVVTFLWRAAGEPEPETTNNPFADVKEGSWYYKAVLWAAETGVTAGTSATTFSPDATCTRAQIVTFLWRFEGEPASTTTDNPFTDVKAGAYYEKAVLWASETGVTAGTSATTFSPDATCTRAQVVTFLYRDIES